jgi:hypothetical protein
MMEKSALAGEGGGCNYFNGFGISVKFCVFLIFICKKINKFFGVIEYLYEYFTS